MIQLLVHEFSLSTADDERNYFMGPVHMLPAAEESILPQGTYRVVDGVLCQVIPAVPPTLTVTQSAPSSENAETDVG